MEIWHVFSYREEETLTLNCHHCPHPSKMDNVRIMSRVILDSGINEIGMCGYEDVSFLHELVRKKKEKTTTKKDIW